MEIEFIYGINDELKSLRTEVFYNEQKFPLEAIFESDNKCLSAIIRDNNQIIASGRIHKINENTAKLERICVRKQYRLQGYGLKINQILILKATELGIKRLEIEAQYDKKDFYRKLGFVETTGEVIFIHNREHIKMYKDL